VPSGAEVNLLMAVTFPALSVYLIDRLISV